MNTKRNSKKRRKKKHKIQRVKRRNHTGGSKAENRGLPSGSPGKKKRDKSIPAKAAKRERERKSITSSEKRIDFMLILGEGHLKVELYPEV